MAGPPSDTEVAASAGHAALSISAYSPNPNVATLAGVASFTFTSREATTEIGSAPQVLSVTVDSFGTTSATITWSVDQFVTGRIEYGTTISYGSLSTEETSYDYSTHIQTILGLTAGTEYHFRVIGQNSLGQAYASSDQTFTTDALSVASFYGQAAAADSRNDYGPGSYGRGAYAITFRAPATDTVASIVWPFRTSADLAYSKGTGGDVRWAIYPTNADGSPNIAAGRNGPRSDALVGSVTPFETRTVAAISHWTGTKPSLTSGQLYAAVLENLHADPANNYVSYNRVLAWNGASDPVPGTDTPFAFDLDHKTWRSTVNPVTSGMTWTRDTANHGGLDVRFTGGSHAGNAVNNSGYAFYSTSIITGTYRRRERIIVSGGDKTITSVYVRASRQSGTGSLTIQVKNSASTALASVVVPYSSVIYWPSADEGRNASGNWVGGAITPLTLTNGQTYYVEASTTSGTQYYWPIVLASSFDSSSRSYVDASGLLSPYFTDGLGQFWNGSSWVSVYAWTPGRSQLAMGLA